MPAADDDGGEPSRHGRERRPRRRVWPWLLGVFLVLVIAVGGAGWWAYQTYPEQVKTLFGWSNDYTGQGTGSVQVQIRPGAIGSEIAATLVLSHETVKTYVSRILTKLDLRDRVQAVVYAYRRGLVR